LFILIVIYFFYLIVIHIYHHFCAGTDTPHALLNLWVLFGRVEISVLVSTHHMSLPFLSGSCQEPKERIQKHNRQHKKVNKREHNTTEGSTPTNNTSPTDQSPPQPFPSHYPHSPQTNSLQQYQQHRSLLLGGNKKAAKLQSLPSLWNTTATTSLSINTTLVAQQQVKQHNFVAHKNNSLPHDGTS